MPCAKEAAGEAVADSKASDTHNCAKSIGRSIRLFWLSMFIIGLASIIEADTDIGIIADRDTLAPGLALGAKRQPLELSTPLQSFFLQADMRGCRVRSVSPSTSGRTNHQGVAGPSKRWERHRR